MDKQPRVSIMILVEEHIEYAYDRLRVFLSRALGTFGRRRLLVLLGRAMRRLLGHCRVCRVVDAGF